MIALLCVMCAGALVFEEQDTADVTVAAPVRALGAGIDLRVADIDGDGAADIVVSRGVCFQQGGQFRADGFAPFPAMEERPLCDVWPRDRAPARLFLQFREGLKVLEWREGQWAFVVEQALQWPGTPRTVSPFDDAEGAASVEFGRFLHDLDGDSAPELVVPGETGLHIYVRDGAGYRDLEPLAVFPALAVAGVPPQRLWPEEARHVVFPVREMACRFVLEGDRLTVAAAEPLPGQNRRFRITEYRLDAASGYQPAATRETVTEPLPVFMKPRRLNPDGVLDFAGTDWTMSETLPVPAPVSQTCASTDGGKTVQTVRSNGFQTWQCFADIDNDGFADMITEATGLYDGGVREAAARFLTGRNIRHEVRIHLQRPGGTFPAQPDIRAPFTIHLDRPPVSGSRFLLAYLWGELLDLSGDYDGDGRRDIALRDRVDRLAVYLNRGMGFSAKADASVPLKEDEGFVVLDLDGDGRSDLLLTSAPRAGEIGPAPSRVLLNREREP